MKTTRAKRKPTPALDLVERMARGHWEQARAQVEEASPTATKGAA